MELWPRQMEAFETPATELLFGGATEGGKSHMLRIALATWCLGIPGLQCVLIRKKYDDILKNHVEGPTGFKALLAPLIERGMVQVTQDGVRFPLGSNIAFQHCQDERQFDSAQGVEKHVLALDEATQISERLIRFFRTWVRAPKEFKATLPDWAKGKFPRIIYTANPIGVSVGFFRRHFVKARPAFSMEPVEGFIRQYIPSRAADNLSVDVEATKGRLAGLNDPSKAKALLDGDWDAPTGDFFSEWDEARHVVPDFIPPVHWFRYRTFDWGNAEPFAVYWWAVSDGEQFKVPMLQLVDGIYLEREVQLWFPRGALICYREWYGCQPDNPDKGLRMRNEEIAQGILARSKAPEEKGITTLTDSYPFPDRGEGKTIAETFADNGVPLELGKTARVTGWSQMRSRLIGKEFETGKRIAMLFFCACCKYARDYIPALPRHPSEQKMEDAAEHGEATHSCDAVRLACMARAEASDLPAPDPDTAGLKNEITFEQAIVRVKKYKAGAGGARY